MNFIRIFIWGLIISFLGSLPLGTLNIAAMQLGIYESIKNAIMFSLGSLLVEMIYVRISLVGIDWVRKQERIMRIMEWLTLGIVLALAAINIYAALHAQATEAPQGVNPYRNIDVNRFLLGAGMCAINPVQIPFWFGWSAVLFEKGVLQPSKSQYNLYILGIGLGTLLGNSLFIFGGRYLVSKINNSQVYLNWLIAGIFIITAIVQLVKILRKKGSGLQEKLDQHKEFTELSEHVAED